MVLTQKVGTRRDFATVAVLFVVTFGLYAVYWHYKVQNELYKQFELHQEPRDEGAVWLLYGYAVFRPLVWVFLYILVDNVHHVRARFGMESRPTPGRVLGPAIPGAVLGYAGLLMLYGALLMAFGAEEGAETSLTLVAGLAVVGALLVLLGGTLLALAYAPLQHAINEVWDAYDARMEELRPRGPPREPVQPWPEAPPTPAGGPSAGEGGSWPDPRGPDAWPPER